MVRLGLQGGSVSIRLFLDFGCCSGKGNPWTLQPFPQVPACWAALSEAAFHPALRSWDIRIEEFHSKDILAGPPCL